MNLCPEPGPFRAVHAAPVTLWLWAWLPVAASFLSELLLADEKRLEFFDVPWAAHVRVSADKNDPHYPLVYNRFAQCLPGKMYNLWEFFEEHGAESNAESFVWYNPDAKLLLVRGSSELVELANHFVWGVLYDPKTKLRLDFHVFILPPTEDAVLPPKELRASFPINSGARFLFTAEGGEAIECSLEMEPTVSPHRRFVDHSMVLKITYAERSYTLTANSSLSLGEPQSFLLGTTATGEEVRCELTFRYKSLEPDPFLDDPDREEELRKCIEAVLTKDPPDESGN